MNEAMKKVAPQLDVLLSLHKIIGSSTRVVEDIVTASAKDEAASVPVIFLTASKERLTQGDKDRAAALFKAGVALGDVDFKRLQTLLAEVAEITGKLDDVGNQFTNELGVDAQYSYMDPILMDWAKEAWKSNFSNAPAPKDMAVMFFNVDAAGNGFMIVTGEVEGAPKQFKVTIVDHEPTSMKDVEKAFMSEDENTETSEEVEASTTESAPATSDEDVTASWHFCPSCGGGLKDQA